MARFAQTTKESEEADECNATTERAGRETWERVAPIPEAAARLFYGRLFETNPWLRPLFPAGEQAMEEQGRKLMQMITVAVRGLDRLNELTPALEDLGPRHVSYGVRSGDYETVGAALLWTLEQGLQESFTPEVGDAWAATYELLAGAMKGGADREIQR